MAKTVGIIGGLGPLAGAHFYRRLVEKTPVAEDSGHLPIRLWSAPDLPSRLDHMHDRGKSPGPQLIRMAEGLIASGAEFLVIPSSTTHHYYDEISAAIKPVPIVNLLEEVAAAIAITSIRTVGILATTPTVEFDLYHDSFSRHGIIGRYPDSTSQAEVMDIIIAVKSGQSTSDTALGLLDIASRPWMHDCQGLVLACTEIPLIFPHRAWERADARPLFDATDILAEATIRMSVEDQTNGGANR